MTDHPRNPTRILLIDDSELVRRGVKSVLSATQCDPPMEVVGEASTVAEGVNACLQLQPHVVLLDIRLPKTPGEEVFQRMKEENAAVKVVIASGYLAANVKADLTFAGVKRFVNKPYVLSELLEVFHDVIEND